MRPDLPWNVAGIPSEAREAARAAARREGLSVGEWLTRRILSGLSDMSEASARDEWSPSPEDRATAARRDSDEMLERVSRSEEETAGVYRRIEEQLRGLSRRLDASERSQSENNRAMNKAAVEMSISAREQSQAFDQLGSHVVNLSERIERVEHQGGTDSLRDAVKALHQGLSRLADQISQTANQSATQISALAGNLESVASRLGQARHEAETSAHALESRIAALDERVRTVEKAAQANADSLERALAALEARQAARKDDSTGAIARLEESVNRLEERGPDPALDRRLSGIERTLGGIVERIDREEHAPEGAPDGLKKLAQRLDALETAQREALAELRKTATDKAQAKTTNSPPPYAGPAPFAGQGAPAPSAYEVPPFADVRSANAGFASPPAYDTATGSGSGQQFPPAQGSGADAFAPSPPTVDSYLSAARRSARAAAQAEAERAAGSFGGFGSDRSAAPVKPARKRSGRTRTLLVGVLVLVGLAVVLGNFLSHRIIGEALPNSVISALFEKKPPAPPAKPSLDETSPVAATASQKSESVIAAPPPKPEVKSSPAGAVPSAVTSAPPSPSPVPRKIEPAPQRRLAVQPPTTRTGAIARQGPPAQQAAVKPTHPMTAIDRLTSLANAGNARAELVVGLKYLDGDGVPADDKQAAKWLERAAQAGEPVAEYRLGTMYERGRGMVADAVKAVRLYLAAANRGNRKAMHNLAVAYAQGSGVKKDFAEATRWFVKAANLGLADSQFNLAVLYERGLGVPQSLLDAYKWYAIAASQGDAESKSRLEVISNQLSAEAKAAAQHAAALFKSAPLDVRANVAPTLAELMR